MTFEVPESKAAVEPNDFPFKIPGHKGEFSVRRLKFLPIGQRNEIGWDQEAILDFFGKTGTKQGDAVRSLDEEQYKALVKAWEDDSEVSVGESGASSS